MRFGLIADHYKWSDSVAAVARIQSGLE